MTFAAWYDSIIVPQLNETLKNVLRVARPDARRSGRRRGEACAEGEAVKTRILLYPPSSEPLTFENVQHVLTTDIYGRQSSTTKFTAENGDAIETNLPRLVQRVKP